MKSPPINSSYGEYESIDAKGGARLAPARGGWRVDVESEMESEAEVAVEMDVERCSEIEVNSEWAQERV